MGAQRITRQLSVLMDVTRASSTTPTKYRTQRRVQTTRHIEHNMTAAMVPASEDGQPLLIEMSIASLRMQRPGANPTTNVVLSECGQCKRTWAAITALQPITNGQELTMTFKLPQGVEMKQGVA